MKELKNILIKFKILYIIIKAKIYDKYKNRNTEWYKERKKICKECPLNSKNLKENKNFRYYILSFLNFRNSFCTYCGCEINAKISVEEENCPTDKW